MNTYVKVNNHISNATIHFLKNHLYITSHQGYFKGQTISLKCQDIYYVTSTSVFGGKQICFSYENTYYTLYTQGLGMADYFERHLGL
ncbi:hypothetical protein [Vagococcus intermedius]|uniref:Uncharacterized protein n=1 Tax=Vagococcus intermedius TaxID=2991418 RepID=A0AAF0CVW7_9ENTE|nr:hypothetical protein [Vagococcus intermedius]WEG73990.1 hypothetical protein OL234_03510 [Vagococcus intermedius]WEG76070.1 hypothetical protein OL235_03515 [Vagococcus intermedius]